jgi:prepilin-type N-terminal cleavage/methylation domain-containing protein
MRNKGFTLIEMVLTISILSLVLSLAFLKISPDFGYMERMADEFAMDVRYIQMENMKKPEAIYKISINKNAGCYYIYKSVSVEKVVSFKNRYEIDYSNQNMDYICFDNEGAPINAGTFSIRDKLTNETEEVSIVPTTGRTIIKE